MTNSELDRRDITLDIMEVFDICTFSVTLVYACYNAVKFLVIQGRWNSFYLMPFYVLAIVISTARIVQILDDLLHF